MPNGKFCPKCKADFSNRFEYCTKCGTQLKTQTFCPSCGIALTRSGKYCPQCGEQVNYSHNDMSSIPSSSKIKSRNLFENLTEKRYREQTYILLWVIAIISLTNTVRLSSVFGYIDGSSFLVLFLGFDIFTIVSLLRNNLKQTILSLKLQIGKQIGSLIVISPIFGQMYIINSFWYEYVFLVLFGIFILIVLINNFVSSATFKVSDENDWIFNKLSITKSFMAVKIIWFGFGIVYALAFVRELFRPEDPFKCAFIEYLGSCTPDKGHFILRALVSFLAFNIIMFAVSFLVKRDAED
jgi:hypothetical protein